MQGSHVQLGPHCIRDLNPYLPPLLGPPAPAHRHVQTCLFWSICSWQAGNGHLYHPQWSCGKVMFLHLSVILSTWGCLPQCMLGYIPSGRHPPGRHPPGQTPPTWQTPPLGRHPLRSLQRTVRIPLECILVQECFSEIFNVHRLTVSIIYWRCHSPVFVNVAFVFAFRPCEWTLRIHKSTTALLFSLYVFKRLFKNLMFFATFKATFLRIKGFFSHQIH